MSDGERLGGFRVRARPRGGDRNAAPYEDRFELAQAAIESAVRVHDAGWVVLECAEIRTLEGEGGAVEVDAIPLDWQSHRGVA